MQALQMLIEAACLKERLSRQPHRIAEFTEIQIFNKPSLREFGFLRFFRARTLFLGSRPCRCPQVLRKNFIKNDK